MDLWIVSSLLCIRLLWHINVGPVQDMRIQAADRHERELEEKWEKKDVSASKWHYWPNVLNTIQLIVRGSERQRGHDETDCLLSNCWEMSINVFCPRVQVESARLQRAFSYWMKRKSKTKTANWNHFLIHHPLWSVNNLVIVGNESLTDDLRIIYEPLLRITFGMPGCHESLVAAGQQSVYQQFINIWSYRILL